MQTTLRSLNAIALAFFMLAAQGAANATVLYVKPGSTGTAPYGSWATATGNIQTAITSAIIGDTVWVAAGTYQPMNVFSFFMKAGVKIYGGFAGTETAFTQRNIAFNKSTLLGNGRVVILNSYNGLTAADVLDGFIIKNGAAVYGGGMYNIASSPTISNCVFTGNAAAYGGGMYNRGSSPNISNCTFVGNTSNYGGGGIYNGSASSPAIANCTFAGNTASNAGLGVGIYNFYSASPIITNCIFWDAGNNEIYNDNANAIPIVTYCNVKGGYTGTGNINTDPIFLDATNPAGADAVFGTPDDGLQLRPCSPALNMGDNSTNNAGYTTQVGSTDIAGNTRIQLGRVDMGAYESAVQSSATDFTAPLASVSQSVTMLQADTTIYANCGSLGTSIFSNGANPASGSITVKVTLAGSVVQYQGKTYVRRQYDITPLNATVQNTGTAQATLYYTQSDFDDYNANNGAQPDFPTGPNDAVGISNIRIHQQHGTSATGAIGTFSGWAGTGPSNVTITPLTSWNATRSRWELSFPVTGFSGFFASSAATPLPLQLLSFTGSTQYEGNLLQWRTAMEEDVDFFEIGISANAQQFIPVAQVAAKGNSDNIYTHRDQTANKGRLYYRLKVVNRNGSHTYSSIIAIDGNRNGGSVRMYPNPATNQIWITLYEARLDNTTVQITDGMGRCVWLGSLSGSSTVISISALPSGFYHLRLADGTTLPLYKQ